VDKKVRSHCFGCNKPLFVLKKYCDDKCKDTYYGKKRKTARAMDRIIAAIKVLEELRADNSKVIVDLATEYLLEVPTHIKSDGASLRR
jgi:predicted nucleic acid-binding Zn ribbon protein